MFVSHRYKIEPVLRSRGLDSESRVGHSAGDSRGDREVCKFLLRVTGDLTYVDSRFPQELVELQPRSRTLLAIHEARARFDEIVQPANSPRVTGGQYQSLLARNKMNNPLAARFEKGPVRHLREFRLFAVLRDVESRKIALAASKRCDSIETAAKLQIEPHAALLREQIAQRPECEIVASMNAQARPHHFENLIELALNFSGECFELW